MPLQNRVQPTGEFIADRTRGAFMGNRGILHDDTQQLGRARWQHKAWVTCKLNFNGRHRDVMSPRRYTELFFYDEAVAFAAGHRPCAECRRSDYTRFRQAAGIKGKISAFDKELHAQRTLVRPHRQRRIRQPIDDLPDGVFILLANRLPALVWQDLLVPFAAAGYGEPLIRPRGQETTLLTPLPLVTSLREGYCLDIRHLR